MPLFPRCGDIGEDPEEYEFEPFTGEPVPEVVPTTPPVREPVPA